MISGLIVLAVCGGALLFAKSKKPDFKKALPEKSQTEQKELIVRKSKEERKASRDFNISTVALITVMMSNTFPAFLPVSISLLLYTSFPVFKGAIQTWHEKKKFGNDAIVSSSILLCFAIRQYTAIALGAWFYFLGSKIITETKEQSKEKFVEIFKQQSSTVWMLKDGVEIQVPLDELRIGDMIVVGPGESIPVDGKIIDGRGRVAQQSLIGESWPSEKGKGDRVFASTVVITGRIVISVEKTEKEIMIAKIEQILNSVEDVVTNSHMKGDEWADKGAAPIMGFSGLTWLLLGPTAAAVVLSSHFGNRIRIIGTLGTLNHLNLSSDAGIFIKDGRVLEALLEVDTFMFDKTGTLTKEQPEIAQIISSDHYRQEEILTYAATAESQFSHPIAKAILKEAKKSGLTLKEVEDSNYRAGYGIIVKIENRIVQVGSVRHMMEEGIGIPREIEVMIGHAHAQGHSMILVSLDDQLIGAIELKQSIRPEALQMIQGLRARGYQNFYILSGDHQQPTKVLADHLNIGRYFYEVLPEEKAKIVEQLQKEGKKVCFVGDGINDLIAMRKANISISLQGSTPVVDDVAQVILMNGNLVRICDLVDISVSLQLNLISNLGIILLPTAIIISGAYLFGMGIQTAVLIKNVGTTVGIANSMRPLKQIDAPSEGQDRTKTI